MRSQIGSRPYAAALFSCGRVSVPGGRRVGGVAPELADVRRSKQRGPPRVSSPLTSGTQAPGREWDKQCHWGSLVAALVAPSQAFDRLCRGWPRRARRTNPKANCSSERRTGPTRITTAKCPPCAGLPDCLRSKLRLGFLSESGSDNPRNGHLIFRPRRR